MTSSSSSAASKESPSTESNLMPSNSRTTLLNDESLTRDFSLASLTSGTSSGSGLSNGQQEEYFQCAEHAEITLRNMQTYLDNKALCDVALVAGIDSKR